MAKPRSYRDDWDEYVGRWEQYARQEPTNQGRTDLVYPGDEWGNPADWRAHAERFLFPYLPPEGVAVEIGPGSGKYTLLVAARVARLVAFDVSPSFMQVAGRRLNEAGLSARTQLELLELQDCREMERRLEQLGLAGSVDLVYSVDSMQHVELHTLAAYLLAAGRALRLGGHLSMTVAGCTTETGFARLLEEMPWYYGGHRPGHQFYFLSPEIVSGILLRLGFELVDLVERRDIDFAARKVREVSLGQPTG